MSNLRKALDRIAALERENAKLKRVLGRIAHILAEDSPAWNDCSVLDSIADALGSVGYETGHIGEQEPTVHGDPQGGSEG